ncbi:sterol desaturase family protein [Haliangium ochraceum]|uniref:Fatty acid hydroxylase n=1 Tax=Haliangium ochraceum (strain DSM 14365 / JCM 11303 / SMP-2) TaxID=502025 RepID=D0LIV9_HALO1|nr:sterol desaturase family protein [Haliangium ochraceum]ACY12988.1 fatty acid hydroxylase [Haliangium ochraceum DSM 14365]
MSPEVLSAIVIVCSAVLIIALEYRFPYERRQRLLREWLWSDLLLYGLFQSLGLGIVIGALIAFIDRHTGWSSYGLLSGWPIWAQVMFFVLTHDFYIYCFHRMQHRSRYLWRLHEAHHSARDIDWIAGSRSHPLEIFINQTIEFAPMILLGAHPVVPVIKGAISAIWGMWIHCNIDVKSGPLQYVINGPEMHRWHHAKDIPGPEEGLPAEGANFATKFAFWDYLFGSAFRPRDRKPAAYGLFDDNGPFPEDYFRQVAAAFRPFQPVPTDPAGAHEPSMLSSESGGEPPQVARPQ